MLKRLYPIPEFDNFVFFSELGVNDALSHKYYYRVAACTSECVDANVREPDGDFVCVEHMQMCDTSITSFIGQFGDKFDADGQSRRCALKELRTEIDAGSTKFNELRRSREQAQRVAFASQHAIHFHDFLRHIERQDERRFIPLPPPGRPVPDELLAQRAEDFRDGRWAYQREYGHCMHAMVEDFYNNQMSELDALRLAAEHPDYFGGFLAYHAEVLSRGWRPFRAELRLYDRETRLVGTIDMAYLDAENRLILADWKFSKNVKPNANWGRKFRVMTPPVLDTTYWKYVLQLNSYKAILERNTALRVHKMFVVVFHEVVRGDFDEFEVPDHSEHIEQMLVERRKVLPKLTQEQYEEALHNKRPALARFAFKNGAVTGV